MGERKQRDNGVTSKQLAAPFDVLKFGSDEDPCFGKLWDPKNDTCRSCGDIEICGIAFSQNTRKKEADIESSQEFLDNADIGEAEKKIKRFIEKQDKKRMALSKMKVLVMKRFKIDANRAKQLISKYIKHHGH